MAMNGRNEFARFSFADDKFLTSTTAKWTLGELVLNINLSPDGKSRK